MAELAWVVLGSALGGAARFGVSGVVSSRVGETFPWGTLVVNVSGALAIGVVAGALGSMGDASHVAGLWHLVVYGFLGSYTTVSSFSLQTLALARDGQGRQALAHIALSLGLCLVGAGAGFAAAARLLGGA